MGLFCLVFDRDRTTARTADRRTTDGRTDVAITTYP